MNQTVYTIEEIIRRITPVAQKYELAAVYLFGSYARGDSSPDSDIDLLVDLKGSIVRGLNFVSLFQDLESALDKSIDLVTLESLEAPTTRRGRLHFRQEVSRERKMIYAAA